MVITWLQTFVTGGDISTPLQPAIGETDNNKVWLKYVQITVLQRHGSRKHNPCFLIHLLIDLLRLVADPPRWTYVCRCYQQTDPRIRRGVNSEIEVSRVCYAFCTLLLP